MLKAEGGLCITNKIKKTLAVLLPQRFTCLARKKILEKDLNKKTLKKPRHSKRTCTTSLISIPLAVQAPSTHRSKKQYNLSTRNVNDVGRAL